jgi:hypothetical protein
MNPESVLFGQLSILDQVYSHPIDTYDDVYSEIVPSLRQWLTEHGNAIRTPLQKHQTQMVTAMMLHVVRMSRGFTYGNQVVRGKLGMVADPPGSGKTLSVLAFLSAIQGIQEADRQLDASGGEPSLRIGDIDIHSNQYFYSNEVVNISDTSGCNLVVVSQTLLEHWKQEVAKHTTLQPFVVDTRRILRNQTTAERMVQSPFVLVTNKTYRHVLDYAEEHNLHWKHLFFDDAAHIFLSNTDPLPKFDFLWLITSDWMSFLLKNTHFHRASLQYARERMALSPECNQWIDSVVANGGSHQTHIQSSTFFKPVVPYAHPCRPAFVLRNSSNSWSLRADVREITYPCASNMSCSQLTPAFLASRSDLGTMIPTLFQSLGLDTMSHSDLCGHYREREALLARKLEDDCSICLEPTKNRVLLSCCMGSFCGECILRQLVSRPDANCPTCRAHLYLPNFLYVPRDQGEEGAEGSSHQMLTKQEQALECIRHNPTGSFIIYSSYDNTYYQLQPLLQQRGVTCELLSMPLNRFHHTLRGYQEGRIKVLFVNDVELVRGLNLQVTSHLLFFYGSPFYDIQQTLMNATLRQGRTAPLTVVRLTSAFE